MISSCMCVQGPSPPCHETSHNVREKDFRDHRQDRRHPRDRDADRSRVSVTRHSSHCYLLRARVLLSHYPSFYCMNPALGQGTPFCLCSSLVHTLPHFFCSFLLFPFFLFSFTLLIFFYCPSHPFLPESSQWGRRILVG